jgi:twitching motility protein PilT
MITIQQYHQAAQKQGASDLYLSVGSRPRLKINGRLLPLMAFPPVDGLQMQSLLEVVFATDPLPATDDHLDRIITHTIHGQGRLRIVLSHTRRGMALACRLIPLAVPAFETLGLPDTLKHLVDIPHGLVLVIGRAGSGKSTTLAALVDVINTRFSKFIVTVEHPVEFHHKNKRSVVEQIDCGLSRPHPAELDHSGVLKTADVVLLDGLKTRHGLPLGLSLAAGGKLALVAVESNGGAAEVLKRMLDGFPAAERDIQRRLLARNLRGAAWQHLLPLKDASGRRPAVEILLNDTVVSGLIGRLEGLHLVRPTMAAGRAKGMRTMHQALEAIKQQSVVDEAVLRTFERTMLTHYVYPAQRAF